MTGARIIPLPLGGDVVRTGATTSYYFEIPDQQGTSDLYLDDTAQNPTWRQFTPYGAPRGPAVTWVDNHAFLNKPADPATGLDYVGARPYNPQTGQFTTPDPILNTADPASLDPYAYAQDNPVTASDPTGLDPIAAEIAAYLGSHPSPANDAILKAATTSPAPAARPYVPQAPIWAAPPKATSHNGPINPLSVLDPRCAGAGCSWMSGGDLGVSTGSSTLPIIKNRTQLNKFGGVGDYADNFSKASYGSWLLKKRAGELAKLTNKNTEELVSGGRVLRWGGVSLTVAGGAVSAYGEWNNSHSNVAKTVTVGIGDTALGFLAGAAGSMAGGFIAGTAWGAAVGTVIPGGGTAVGAVAGALIGGLVGLASSDLFNDAINSRMWSGITSLF